MKSFRNNAKRCPRTKISKEKKRINDQNAQESQSDLNDDETRIFLFS